MSLSRELCWSSVQDVASRLGLEQVAGAAVGEAYQVLRSEMSPDPVGEVRVFRGAVSLVYVAMTVPMIGLDSHMMFAFTPPESTVPHFTVDSVQNPDAYAFHLDLIPRVDLGSHLGYMDHCYGALTEPRRAALALEGLTPADLQPRQWALMSEWMLANHCDEATFRAIATTVDTYRERWFELLAEGVPDELVSDVSPELLAARDRANREAIFNPDVDRVWAQVERLLGHEQSESVRLLLAGAGAEAVQR
jgi:hypothetical protein